MSAGPDDLTTVRDLQADLRVVEPDAWGAAMVYFTGSKAGTSASASGPCGAT